MKILSTGIAIIVSAFCGVAGAHSAIIDTSNLTRLAGFHSEGLWDLENMGTWNGEPISETNMPTDSHRRLAADINMYSDSNNTSSLYLTFDNVITGEGIWAWGSAFSAVTLTGGIFSLPASTGYVSSIQSFSDEYALPNQRLLSSSSSVITDNTYGYTTLISDNDITVKTLSTSGDYGMVSFGSVTNAYRYNDSGAFRIDFGDDINLFEDIDFSEVLFTSRYGNNVQFLEAEQVFAYIPPEKHLVTTDQPYLTDALTLGDTFTFDYWWEMGMEPTGFNCDFLWFNGTQWETFGWALNFDGSSDGWNTASFFVPSWAQGDTAQIRFQLFDWGQQTNPIVYLRNIKSSPVPEPTTAILFCTGLAGLAGVSRQRKK